MELTEEFEESVLKAIKGTYPSKNKLAIILKDDEGVTQYCCVSCPKKYTEKEKLELHICVHTKEYKHICGICGTGLKRKEHLDRHTLEHQEYRPHICPVCSKAFKRKEHLNIHKAIHSGDKSLACTICGRCFYRKDHLQKHIQTHSKTFIENNIQFDNDEMIMDVKQEMMDDYIMPLLNNASSEMEYEIPIMNEFSYNDSTSYVLPTTENHIDNERPFGCHLCSKTYKRKDHLKLHLASHNKKEHTCSVCGKVFYNTEKLFHHMKMHMQPHIDSFVSSSPAEGDPDMLMNDNLDLLIERPMNPQSVKLDRPHECPICFRKFKRKQHLKVHGNVHAKHQPTIWCSLCKEGFYNNNQFETHECHGKEDCSDNQEEISPQITIQPAKKENKLPSDCIQVVLDESSQNEPRVMLVEEEQLPVPQRVFVCKYCNKPFKRKDHYKIHLNIHTGVKSFFCTECGKGFYRKDHLQKHTQVHTKVKVVTKKEIPDLYPISMMPGKSEIKPEITIHAPSNSKLRVPLQIKVPYQMVMSMDNGEQRAVTIHPKAGSKHDEFT